MIEKIKKLAIKWAVGLKNYFEKNSKVLHVIIIYFLIFWLLLPVVISNYYLSIVLLWYVTIVKLAFLKRYAASILLNFILWIRSRIEWGTI